MIDKRVSSLAEAVAGIQDDSVILVGGFGSSGRPADLMEALLDLGARGLTIVANNATVGDDIVGELMSAGRIRKVVCSFPRGLKGRTIFDELYAAGKIELELVPQGTLAERIRAGAAGIGGFFTRTAAGTRLAEGKETRVIDGQTYVLEAPIKGDVALLKGLRGDRWGNLVYHRGARINNPVMAGAARLVVAQVREIVPLGTLDPEHIITPGVFVDRLVEVPMSAKLSRQDIARVAAQDIPDGACVNLGIGLPTLIADYVPDGRELMLHSEQGLLGLGPAPAPGEEDYDVINAGKFPVTLLPGASVFSHSESFLMIRGGHIQIACLGAFQVAANGDLANWTVDAPHQIPGVGGAMDLAAGAEQVWVLMEHCTKDGQPRILEQCAYPLTAPGCVDRIYTDLAVIDVTEAGLVVTRLAPGWTLQALQAVTGAALTLAPDWSAYGSPATQGE